MSIVRFIGCLHLEHNWMAQHRGFNDSFYHDEYLIDKWNSVVNRKDLVYILGDVSMEKSDPYIQLDRLNGRKIVVLGNHDLPKHVRSLLEHVESVAGMIDYKGYTLTHAPIHPNEIARSRGNIHAHIHENVLSEFEAFKLYNDDQELVQTLSKYHNVDAKLIDFTPKTLEELRNE